MSELLNSAEGSKIKLIYDGDCPFCSNYVAFIKLRGSIGGLQLINVRESPEWKAYFGRIAIDLNRGFAILKGTEVLHGDAALAFLASNTRGDSLSVKLNRLLFGSATRAIFLYPLLRFGRTITLRILGRKPIL